MTSKTDHHAVKLNADELNALYQYAFGLCQQRDDAYDLLQGSLEKYLIELKRQRQTIHNPKAFIRTLIRNRFIDQYRYDKRWNSVDESHLNLIDLSIDTLEHLHIQQDQLTKIWRQLNPIDRDILYHWAILGYSTQETSDQLQIPKGTLLSRIHRLRQRLTATANLDQGAAHE